MTKKRNLTIREVAQHAGVSTATVSRILNGIPNVSEEARLLVEASLKELGFQPSYLSRALASGKSMSIGIVAQNIESAHDSGIVAGIEQHLLSQNYHPVLNCGYGNVQQEQLAIETLLYRKVDAMILLHSLCAEDFLKAVAQKIPLFIFGREVPGLESNCLMLDHHQGGYLATRHLVELGHRDIVHIHGPVNPHDDQQESDSEERFKGYRLALIEAGMKVNMDLVVQGDFTEKGGFLAMNQLLDAQLPFSAVFASNDQMALGAMLALQRRGLGIPEDVSVVGYDDTSWSGYVCPPLTTVHQPIQAMGRALALMACNHLQGKQTSAPFFKLALKIRESTKPHR